MNEEIIHMHTCVMLRLYSVVLLAIIILEIECVTNESCCIMKTASRPSLNSRGYSPQYWGLWAVRLVLIKVNLLPFTQPLQESNFITVVRSVCTCSLCIIGIYVIQSIYYTQQVELFNMLNQLIIYPTTGIKFHNDIL